MAGRAGTEYTRLSSEVQEIYGRKKQTSAEYDRKNEWRADIERIIRQKYPGCQMVFYGSSANGFGTTGCDIDLTLFLASSNYRLSDINNCFTRTPHRFQTEVVSAAVVPIVKLKDKSSYSYESDISVNNLNGITNTLLMSCYAKADPRVAPLVVIIKLWAEKSEIKGARINRLPGFALALFVIHFLQAGCDPPVVPALQQRFPGIIPSDMNAIIQHLENRTVPSCVSSLKSENTQSLGELLVGFFQYYCTFKWSDTISIRNGGTQITPCGRKWRNPYIRMEDPENHGNVTRSVYDSYEFSRIKHAFSSANTKLRRGLSLDSIV